MINNSMAEYVFIRLSIFFLRYIGPVCTLNSIWFLRKAYLAFNLRSEIPSFTLLQYYCLAEATFYVFFLGYRIYLQKEATHPPLKTREEREALFRRTQAEVHDPVKFLKGWFRGGKFEEIGREDVKDFLDWAFFEGRAAKKDDHTEELEDYVAALEGKLSMPLKEGSDEARPLKLTMDPIEMECRSLTWYAMIMFVDSMTHLRLQKFGFKFYTNKATSRHIFPPRPAALTTKSEPSATKSLSYWLVPHTSKTHHPIVFLHGIGIGLYPNVGLLGELNNELNGSNNKKDGQIGIMAVEILPISSRLTAPILTQSEFVAQFTQVLDAHKFDKFVLSSHSYGSVLSTGILTHPALSTRVVANLFIDPVTFLLHMPDVAYNFTVREPREANEWQLWYFASKDPGVAYTLGRHFFWSDVILFREQLLELVKRGVRVTVCLGSRDLIVDTQAVGSYLMRNEIPDPVLETDEKGHTHMELKTEGKKEGKMEEWKTGEWKGEGLEVAWFEGLDHAQVFDSKQDRGKLIRILKEYSRIR